MSNSRNQQLFQIQNILETLLEATDHFYTLIKQNDLNQSIYAFTSIVEGSQAIVSSLNQLDEDFTQQTIKLEKNLHLIASHLENSDLRRIPEVLQFSLRPLFVQLIDTFKQNLGDQKTEETVSIGVFHSWKNPRDFFPQKRLEAMVNEGYKQATTLYFFTSEDVDFDKEQITADLYRNHRWERITAPFPDVINNNGAGKRSQAERKLSRMVPFTSFYVGNKFTLPKRMIRYRKFADLLVPFKVCTDKYTIDHFLEENDRVVFKALGSNRGENIYFVTRKGNRYHILDQKKERLMNSEDFQSFINHTILKKTHSFIIQKYIHTRTKADEPYHFRAHVQKDGEGKWDLTHIYPRIGSKKSSLSNISTEGRIEDFPLFLQNEFGETQGATYEKEILRLSLDVAIHLDQLYGLAISELGIDFAIDDTGRIWMHEANNGPQTAFHEEKRAVNTIAYAKYIAKNGVMYSTAQTKPENHQFQVEQSRLPHAIMAHGQSIGMMTGEINEKLTQALHEAAEASEKNLFYFHPNDIDFDHELIKAYFFENGEWIPKITTYPNVIIDYVKLRGKKDANYIYEELEDIPFTNPWPQHIKSRSEVYQQLHQDEQTSAELAAFETVNRPYDVIRFIKKYGGVMMKPNSMNFINFIDYIERQEGDSYKVTRGQASRIYNENNLRNYVDNRMKEKNLIIQENTIANTHDAKQVTLHLMLDAKEQWNLVEKSEPLENETEILKRAFQMASFFKSLNEEIVSEANLTLTIEHDQSVRLQEIDLSGTVPSAVNRHEAAIAKATIDYALSLI